MPEDGCLKGLRAGAIAKREGVTDRYVSALLPLAMMAPSVVTAIVE
jgi:hypothetical protein